MVIQLIMIVMDHRVPRSTVSAPERSRHLIGWIRLRTRALIGLARGRNWGRVAQQSGACRGCLSLVRLSPLHLRHREAVIARHWYICQYVSRVEERAGDLLMMTWNWGGHSRWTFWTWTSSWVSSAAPVIVLMTTRELSILVALSLKSTLSRFPSYFDTLQNSQMCELDQSSLPPPQVSRPQPPPPPPFS